MKITHNDTPATVFELTRAEINALLAHASTDATRSPLYQLSFDCEKGRVCATDGHRLAIAQVRNMIESRPGVSFSISRGEVEKIAKIASAKSRIGIVSPAITDFIVHVWVDTVAMKIPLCTDKAPPYDHVLPYTAPIAEHTGAATAFSPAYLADINLIAYACPPRITEKPNGKKEKHYVSCELYPPTDSLSPLTAKIKCPANETDWTVVIMPCRP